MAGKGIKDLKGPPRRYHLGQARGFETPIDTDKEDGDRARLLRAQGHIDPVSGPAMRELADWLDPAVTAIPMTCASRRYMRDQRLRVIGQLWRLYDEA